MTECQEERRRCLYQAARALRFYREFKVESNEERMRFWDGIFRFWWNEYREQSELVMSGGNERRRTQA